MFLEASVVAAVSIPKFIIHLIIFNIKGRKMSNLGSREIALKTSAITSTGSGL
jgi:hypothetical protein